MAGAWRGRAHEAIPRAADGALADSGNRLSVHAGVPMDDPAGGLPPEVVALARSGDRMGAITKYRELLGGDVKTAQAAIAAI